jgi:outer membrane protein OmpA-like peptidoglycan-associated protein
VLAGEYSIPGLLAQIDEMKSQSTDFEKVEVVSPFAKLADVRFQGSVVFFDFDDDEIDDNFVPAVDEVARLLKADDMLKVTVSGYADPRGSESYNEELAANRAQAVADLLIEQGVPAARINAVGMGNRYARFTENPVRMQLERRVDVTITVDQQKTEAE